jgi:hypothetical protein
VNCYSCGQPATAACRRCAKDYCEEHGNAQYCADCLRPASALPSFNLYRGALLTMLIGTALAIFLLLRPPGETRGAPVIVGQSTPTPRGSGATPEPTLPPRTPLATQAATSPTAAPSPTENPFREYVVQDGDTLFSIAEAQLPAGDDLSAYVQAIATLNRLDPETAVLSVGQVIQLPPLPPAP